LSGAVAVRPGEREVASAEVLSVLHVAHDQAYRARLAEHFVILDRSERHNRIARELDDAICHLRLNELEIGTLVFKSLGDPAAVLAYDAALEANKSNWLVREILNNWKRVLKRIDVTSRSLVTLPAEKTGPTSKLKISTYATYHGAYRGKM